MTDLKKKVALLSNVTVELIAEKLGRKYDFYLPDGFDSWVHETINPEAGLYREKLDAVIVLLDGTEARAWKSRDEGAERIKLWKQALTVLISKITDISVFVSTIDIRENRIRSLSERKYKYEFENNWYQYVQGVIERKSNIYLLDLADTIAEIGRKRFYSNKMWYISNMPYSREGLNAVVMEIDRVLSAAFNTRKKIIALDLDNTLWGGVVGEDGIEGIELSRHKEGQRYYDFQRQLFEMKNRGILLAINSKNNFDDAEAVIRGHSAMLLRDNDFVSRKINWENKAVNLRAMESELNLTEGSFIFIDDNPMEREIAKGECPEMLIPDFPVDTTQLLEFAENIWFDHCRPLCILSEDLKKTQMYQNEAKRKQEMNESINLNDYLAKLEMVVDIHKMRSEELERVTQLINKTNQFNVTTKRYTRAEVEELVKNSNNVIYVVYYSDKYDDSGLISVIVLMNSEYEVRIDTFIMSCRVMGRKLEDIIINELAFKYRKKIIGEFHQTDKNTPVKNLYDRLGFVIISDDENHKVYELDGANYQKKTYEIYKEIRFEE